MWRQRWRNNGACVRQLNVQSLCLIHFQKQIFCIQFIFWQIHFSCWTPQIGFFQEWPLFSPSRVNLVHPCKPQRQQVTATSTLIGRSGSSRIFIRYSVIFIFSCSTSRLKFEWYYNEGNKVFCTRALLGQTAGFCILSRFSNHSWQVWRPCLKLAPLNSTGGLYSIDNLCTQYPLRSRFLECSCDSEVIASSRSHWNRLKLIV